MKKKHSAKSHMKEAMGHAKNMHLAMEKAHKAMGKVGTVGEEKKAAKKGDYRGNSAKKSNEAI